MLRILPTRKFFAHPENWEAAAHLSRNQISLDQKVCCVRTIDSDAPVPGMSISTVAEDSSHSHFPSPEHSGNFAFRRVHSSNCV